MSETALIQIIEGELVIGSEYRWALAEITEQAQAITEVRDQTQYAQAAEIVGKAHAYSRAIIAAAEPALIDARQAVSNLRDMRDKMIHAFDLVAEPLEKMATQWKQAERKAAQLEQETLNKKRNGTPIQVQPNVPTVPGVRAHVNYSAEVVDEDRLLEAYAKARNNRQLKRAAYLRQFICANLQAINAEARKIKSAQRLEAMIPGVLGREEDKI